MRKNLMLCFVIFIFFNCHISTNATEESVPITVQQMSDRVIVLRVGDKAPFGDIIVNNVVAVNTQRGILLIDTGYYPQSAKTMRNLIQELFGRDDFAYVINTHWHWDHINGNQAFADVPIIGHKNIIPAIQIFEQGLEFFLKQRQGRVNAWKEVLQQAEPGSEQAVRARGWAYAHEHFLSEYRQGFTVVYPSITFNDRLILNMGDLTANMVHFPSLHSDNDIIIHIPEEKLLVAGDLFYYHQLPGIRHSSVGHIQKWVEIFKSLLDDTDDMATVVPGHQNLMTAKDLKKMRDYIQTLWEKVSELREQGLSLNEIQNRLELEKNFEYLKTFSFFESAKDIHDKNIQNVYYSEIPSGVADLKKQISLNGIRQALTYFTSEESNSENYYWDEAELLDLGYDFLMFGRFEQAVGVMRLNVELHPDSWNAWDSLAEAYMDYGQKDLAIESYKKSLELNPGNENAKSMLKKLLVPKQ